MNLIPFFVVDRPISLQIINCFFSKHYYRPWGMLTHAFTSKNFKEKFKNFPKDSSCSFFTGEISNKASKTIYKIIDSGIFFKNRNISYEELFEKYENLNTHFGVIIDFLKDKEKTIRSAENAIKVYHKNKYSFKLIAVAQGKNEKEYLECYKSLIDLGFKYIAIGGLLKRNGNSSIITVSSEQFLEHLLKEIREKFNPDWLFTFGVFHPKRIPLLEKYKVWGADYKGWLFQYDTNYLNLLEILESDFKINLDKFDKLKLISILEKIRLTKIRSKRNALKQELDLILKNYSLSLQEIRIFQILKNLEIQLGLKST